MYGFNGVTIRNNVIANAFSAFNSRAILDGQPATYGYIFNNTIIT